MELSGAQNPVPRGTTLRAMPAGATTDVLAHTLPVAVGIYIAVLAGYVVFLLYRRGG